MIPLVLLLVGAFQGEGAIEIRPVDESGEALPGAEVLYVLRAEESGGASVDWIDGWIESSGRPAFSGDGFITVPWPEGDALFLVARHAERWGFTWLAHGDPRVRPGEPLELALAPDWNVEVLAREGSGRLVDRLPVRLSGGKVRRQELTRGGVPLVFPHVGFESHGAEKPLVVEVPGLLEPPVRVTIGPGRPQGPVTLTVPATGTVEVQLVGPDGRGVENVLVGLTLLPLEDPDPHRRLGPPPEPRRIDVAAREGLARFEHVPVGRSFEARVPGGEALVVVGPTASGETVRALLTCPAPATVERSAGPPTPVAPRPARARLEGTLLLDPGVPPGEVTVVLRSTVSQRESRAMVRAAGDFLFAAEEPRACSLEVFPRGAQALVDRPIVHRDTFDLGPGETIDVGAVDLRGKLFAHRVGVRGAERWPKQGRAFYRRSGRTLEPFLYSWADQADLTLVSPWPRIDLNLYLPGFRVVELVGVKDETEVTLEPGLPVRLRLHTDGALPEPPVFVKAMLVPVDAEAGQGLDFEGASFGPTRELVTTAWKPGRQRVVWLRSERRADGWGNSGVWPEVSPAQTVEVLDLRGEQVFDVSIPAEELARLLGGG